MAKIELTAPLTGTSVAAVGVVLGLRRPLPLVPDAGGGVARGLARPPEPPHCALWLQHGESDPLVWDFTGLCRTSGNAETEPLPPTDELDTHCSDTRHGPAVDRWARGPLSGLPTR